MQVPRRVVALGAVLALHALLVTLWLAAASMRPREAPSPVDARLRLVPDETPRRPQGPLRPLAPAPATPPPAVWLPVPAVETAPAADASGASTVAGTGDPAPGPRPPGPALPSPARALDLRLPAPDRRGAAPERPPAPPASRAIEALLARDLDPKVVEQDLGDGRRRWRRGHDCIEARTARVAQVDPFNQSVQPTPRQVEDCAR